MNRNKKIHVNSLEEYEFSIIKCMETMLEEYFGDIENITLEDIKSHLNNINLYPNFDYLENMRKDTIIILDDENIDISRAQKAILDGKILFEHTVAGEATRLGLGTKYLLNLKNFSIDGIVGHIINEEISQLKNQNLSSVEYNEKLANIYEKINKEKILEKMSSNPSNLLDLSLGNRHMLELSYEISKLAIQNNLDPQEVLKKQTTLIVVNEKTVNEIIDDFIKFNFYGLQPQNVLFMVQKSFHGIYLKEGSLFFDKSTNKNKRLHNHGQMVIQKAHESSIFYILPQNKQKVYISTKDFENILSSHYDLLSFSIEDLSYLESAIDYPSLELALDLRDKGYNMVMEIVENNPNNPQKGGSCFYDKVLNRPVMIECDKLKGIKPEEMHYLNKNFNHYPNPMQTLLALKQHGLPLTLTIKKMPDKYDVFRDYIYVCPPQGDLNFILRTAYFMRKNIKPICSWKSPATTPDAVHAMFKQDSKKGFKEFANQLQDKELSISQDCFLSS